MKTALGLCAVLIAFISYVPYLRNIFRGKTKPHAFSWLIWGLLTGIAFFAQLRDHGAAGAWVTGFTAVVCLIIFLAALRVGKKNIAPVDWLFLIGAGVALLLWGVTDDPTSSVILITIIDMLGFVPTFRKSFHHPHEETTITYTLSAIKFAIAIAALSTFSVVTVLYPLSLVITNSLFVAMVFIRKQKLVADVSPF
ncbi:MAG TPA: hypothetical protein VG992_03695 [Candidatus Saccharimonadales bacterium]|nr:hypothetical protein [Candidatus Saccharimonadales bacterium]